MARITIEDCMEHVPNRFHLVRMATIRAKQLKKGALPLLTSEDNKQIVMSLREIAAGLVKPGDLVSSSNAGDAEASASQNVEAVEVVQTEDRQAEEVTPVVEADEPKPTNEG